MVAKDVDHDRADGTAGAARHGGPRRAGRTRTGETPAGTETGAHAGTAATTGPDADAGADAAAGADSGAGSTRGPEYGASAATLDPKVVAALAAAEAAGPKSGDTVRVDSWIWAVRLVKTRSAGATACRGGHVRVNGERVKPAHSVRVGDEVRLRHEGRERIVVVRRLIRKRVGAPVAVQCYVDNSPPPPPREAVAPAGIRDPGAGRPTKRDRRELERLRALKGLSKPGGRPSGGR
ncbi:RNA-binding S4 domain-containing protein [Streptomyces sp. NPDC005925]|uniref:RNA-binding S4 domain-containing protein n=1 Tax=Streptomyces sp. NPDC005925 TaxID=3157172 RepID=UPI0033E23EBC